MTLGSSGIFSLQAPDNQVSKKYQEIAKIIRSI
jgi:hypothetical protein